VSRDSQRSNRCLPGNSVVAVSFPVGSLGVAGSSVSYISPSYRLRVQAAWLRNHPAVLPHAHEPFPRDENREVKSCREGSATSFYVIRALLMRLRRTESQLAVTLHRDRYRQRHLEKIDGENTSMSLRRFMIRRMSRDGRGEPKSDSEAERVRT